MGNEKKELKKEIGKQLLKIRKKHGLKQEQLSKILGCGRANYSRIEKGEIFPNHLMLVKLKETFNVNINYIVTGQGDLYLKDTRSSLDVLELPPGNQFDKDDRALIDNYCQSSIVRHSLKAYFRTLLLKESETIQMDMEDLKKPDAK